ncbi:MAG: STAS domain-containing protein [Anaerolineales bacterium]
MELKISTENGRVPVTVVHVDGNIDSNTADQFKATADDLIKNGARYFLIDLSHAPFVSSAGLRTLHNIFNALRSINPDSNLSDAEVKKGIAINTYKSPHLKLLNPSKETETTFKLSGFDMYIETFTDLKTALASF